MDKHTLKTNEETHIHELLTEYGHKTSFSEGDNILTEGSKTHYYFYILKGKVKLFSLDDDGREFTHDYLYPGDHFGCFIDELEEVNQHTAQCIEDTDVIRMMTADFKNLLTKDKILAEHFIKFTINKLKAKTNLVKEIAIYSPEDRLKAFLNFLKNDENAVCGKCNKVLLTRQQIADMVGLRVETVIRIMKQMEYKNLFQIKNGKVFLNNNDKDFFENHN